MRGKQGATRSWQHPVIDADGISRGPIPATDRKKTLRCAFRRHFGSAPRSTNPPAEKRFRGFFPRQRGLFQKHCAPRRRARNAGDSFGVDNAHAMTTPRVTGAGARAHWQFDVARVRNQRSGVSDCPGLPISAQLGQILSTNRAQLRRWLGGLWTRLHRPSTNLHQNAPSAAVLSTARAN